jgi:nitrile hydratase
MSDHDHDHSELSEVALRVRALETLLVEKGYVDPAALDALVETYEHKIGRVTAPAWSRAPGAIRSTAPGC